MKICFLFLFCSILSVSCSYKVYVVRHAEKSTSPANDPLLTPEGSQRAKQLREILKSAKIKKIYSTNTTRTRTTAEPLAQQLGITIEQYGPRPDSAFITRVSSFKGNQLIVGHSNTIDDIVNILCGEKVIPEDVSEAVYDNLFIIKLPGRKFIAKKY